MGDWIKVRNESKAYDWNKLKETHLITDEISNTPVLLVLGADNKSFYAFERPSTNAAFFLAHNTLLFSGHSFKLNGRGIDTSFNLQQIPAYQEFWHSWRSFHPGTKRF